MKKTVTERFFIMGRSNTSVTFLSHIGMLFTTKNKYFFNFIGILFTWYKE